MAILLADNTSPYRSCMDRLPSQAEWASLGDSTNGNRRMARRDAQAGAA